MKISSTFGESRGDHFHNAIDIVSVNEPIVPITEANLIYHRFNADNPFEDQLGPGNNIWLEHPGGILSGYYHLKDGRKNILLKNQKLNKTDVLGYTGNTGHSYGPHLHFVLADHYGKKTINPLLLLPNLVDKSSPSIGSLYITTETGFSIVKDGESIQLSRNFPVSVDIIDKGENPAQRRGIHKLKCIINNKVLMQVSFNSITLKNGKWANDEGYTYESLYFNNKYYLENLEFTSGENSVVIITSDFNKNQTVKNFNIFVNPISGNR
jgi:hypothetical protein